MNYPYPIISKTERLVIAPGAEDLALGPSTGRLISEASEVFKAYICGSYARHYSYKHGTSFPRVRASGYDLTLDSTVREIFFSFLPVSLEELWLTQDNVIELCANYPAHLLEAAGPKFYLNLFLIKKDEEYPAKEHNLAVVTVGVTEHGLGTVPFDFSYSGTMASNGPHRVFVRQLPLAV